MGLLWKHPDAIWNLILALVLAIAAAHDLVKQRSVLGSILGLSLAGAFTAVALADLLDLMAREWVRVASNALFGIMGITIGAWNLWAEYRPYLPPKWVNWAIVVLGAGYLLSAVLYAIGYWH
jgi:hypothetical protein